MLMPLFRRYSLTMVTPCLGCQIQRACMQPVSRTAMQACKQRHARMEGKSPGKWIQIVYTIGMLMLLFRRDALTMVTPCLGCRIQR